jgi:hypothetical protein
VEYCAGTSDVWFGCHAYQSSATDVQYTAHRSEGRHAGFTAQRSPLVGALFAERRTGERKYGQLSSEETEKPGEEFYKNWFWHVLPPASLIGSSCAKH